jgi:hypothetical protein
MRKSLKSRSSKRNKTNKKRSGGWPFSSSSRSSRSTSPKRSFSFGFRSSMWCSQSLQDMIFDVIDNYYAVYAAGSNRYPLFGSNDYQQPKNTRNSRQIVQENVDGTKKYPCKKDVQEKIKFLREQGFSVEGPIKRQFATAGTRKRRY